MKTKLRESTFDNSAKRTAMTDPESGLEGGDRLQRIETAAYYKAEARGFAPGMEMEDWLQAEMEVATQQQ